MKKPVTIIGISGTNGSGKDTIGHMLAERHDFLFVSATDLLRAEADRQGIKLERETLRTIGNEWRREYGHSVLVDKALQHFELVKGEYKGLVVASLRNYGEADRIHELGGTVVWVDADPRIRFGRISARLRTTEDIKTFEEFQAEEATEMHRAAGADAATLDVSEVKDRSDISIFNDEDDIETFKTQAEKALGFAQR
jgi:cytidylate kinase